MSIAATADVLHFSTEALPESERIPIWHEVFGRHLIRVEFTPFSASSYFFHAATLRNLSGLSLVSSTCAGFRADRSRALVADGSDDLILTVNTDGAAYASQFGREVTVEANEAVLLSAADIGAISYPVRSRFEAFRVPRRIIAPMLADVDAAVARRLPQSEALRLLTTYVAAADGQAMNSSELRQAFATHVHDLIALALGATRDAGELARNRGLRATRLAAIKADILTRLSDERLSVTELARRHRVTPRYVQLLFEGEGGTFSGYVLEQRLARAYRLLVDPHFADQTISAIAFHVGFSNLSYFNRAFRRRYGGTPSDVREALRRRN